MGRAWIDYPYILQRNFFALPPLKPLIMIRTAIEDTSVTADPMITFTINFRAVVYVIFGAPRAAPTSVPSWTSPLWTCPLGAAPQVFFHETIGISDQIEGPQCFREFPAGQVTLGPRQPTSTLHKMYAVFVNPQ